MKMETEQRGDNEVAQLLGYDGEFKADIAQITGIEPCPEARPVYRRRVATPNRQWRKALFVCVLCLVMFMGLSGLSILPAPDRTLPDHTVIVPESRTQAVFESWSPEYVFHSCVGRERLIPYAVFDETEIFHVYMHFTVDEYWVPGDSSCPGDTKELERAVIWDWNW